MTGNTSNPYFRASIQPDRFPILPAILLTVFLVISLPGCCWFTSPRKKAVKKEAESK